MYDTVKLDLENLGEVSYTIEEVAKYIDVVGEKNYRGYHSIIGYNENLRIGLNNYSLTVEGSLPKWYLGDNLQTMGRAEARCAVEKLSDTLHLPMEKAEVKRLDIAQNILVKHKPELYLTHLGSLAKFNRFMSSGTLYYSNSQLNLVFYDKVKEQKRKMLPIPELLKERNLLRYELRFKKRIDRQFNHYPIDAKLLSDEEFYINIIDKWKSCYERIEKYEYLPIDIKAMKTKKDLQRAAIANLVKGFGGKDKFDELIKEEYLKGELTKKQAHDLREAVNEALRIEANGRENELIKELSQKVKDIARFYR
ncbi:MAG TPA: hypothetical protein P5150_04800 [Candidatus Ratteibacteria bacterium]|nr:hypothetical protein [Candidatus Ratteibacteria bacterium]